MNTYLKALVAGALSLAVAGSASAHVNVRIYAGVAQPYYAPVPHYVVQQPYYGYREVVVAPDWQARREWRLRREREWRRAEWERHEAWRRHHWRMEHRHHHREWDR